MNGDLIADSITPFRSENSKCLRDFLSLRHLPLP